MARRVNDSDRQKRLAEKLRENLARRKKQARARRLGPKPGPKR